MADISKSITQNPDFEQTVISEVIPDCLAVQNATFLLEAPYPNIVTSTILPRPQFGDSEALKSSFDIKRSINGTRYTYVETNNRRLLEYSFRLTRAKYFELRNFVRLYYVSQLKLTNHKGEVWAVYFVTNPFEFVQENKDTVEITLEFDGIRL